MPSPAKPRRYFMNPFKTEPFPETMKTFTKCFGNYNEKGYLTATGRRKKKICYVMLAIR